MRKLVVNIGKQMTVLHCSECGWSYTVRRISDISFKIEEYEATRLYKGHGCEDFPVDEEKPIAS